MSLTETKNSIRRIRDLIVTAVAVGGIVYLTQYLLVRFQVPSYIMPKPTEVAAYASQHWAYLTANTAITCGEALAGFVLGNLLAFAVSLLFVFFPRIERLGFIAAVAVKSTPIVALAPFFVIWFGNGVFGKFIMAALVCYFPMLVNASTGLRSVDSDLVVYMRSLAASERQILTSVRIPNALRYIFSALKTSSTISVVGAIIAELSGSDYGVGHILQVSIYELDTDAMVAGIVAITAFSLLLYFTLDAVEHRVLSRMRLSPV